MNPNKILLTKFLFSAILLALIGSAQSVKCGTPNPNPTSPCGGDDWAVYNDEKCFKLIEKYATRVEAEDVCKGLASSTTTPTLVSIKSQFEQNFVEKLLFENADMVAEVWTGAKRINEEEFVWLDDSPLNYSNWAQDSPSANTKRDCVVLQSSYSRKFANYSSVMRSSTEGKWIDVSCGRANYVLCEKLQVWSLLQLQQTLLSTRKNLQDELDQTKDELHITNNLLSSTQNSLSNTQNVLSSTQNDLNTTKDELSATKNDLSVTKNELSTAKNSLSSTQTELRELKQNPIPIGFLYTQLGNQPEPSILWPTVQWTEVSNSYAGQFFRVVGGAAAPFGQPQTDNAPRLVGLQTYQVDHDYTTDISLPANNDWTGRLFSGSSYNGDSKYYYAHSFKVSSGEVRPQNQAMRLWNRIA